MVTSHPIDPQWPTQTKKSPAPKESGTFSMFNRSGTASWGLKYEAYGGDARGVPPYGDDAILKLPTLAKTPNGTGTGVQPCTIIGCQGFNKHRHQGQPKGGSVAGAAVPGVPAKLAGVLVLALISTSPGAGLGDTDQNNSVCGGLMGTSVLEVWGIQQPPIGEWKRRSSSRKVCTFIAAGFKSKL